MTFKEWYKKKQQEFGTELNKQTSEQLLEEAWDLGNLEGYDRGYDIASGYVPRLDESFKEN